MIGAAASAAVPMNVDYYTADGIIFISHSHQSNSTRKFQFVICCFFYFISTGFFVVVIINERMIEIGLEINWISTYFFQPIDPRRSYFSQIT